MNVIGIDIGGTNFRIGAVNENNELIKFDKIPVFSIFHSSDVLKDLVEMIESFTKGIEYSSIAIGFPATMNADRSRIIQAPNIPFMEDLPVCEVLHEKLGVPVYAERDVTFALCYDMVKYDVKDDGIVSGIYFGTGIGNALEIHGQPLCGRHGTAGELGHIPVFGSSEECGCGNTGCLEAVAGGKALAKMQKEYYPETAIGDMFLKHSQEARVLDFIDLMAIAVATEINILDPDQILLGGGVLNMEGFPKAHLMKRILARSRKPLPADDLHILFTEDEKDKCVIGAAIYSRKRQGEAHVKTL